MIEMTATLRAEDMLLHGGHEIALVTYGLPGQAPINVALECEDCGCVIADIELTDHDSGINTND